jgi:predicted short-subunit dehydrogenase-like oxidoreductase (DUF2520 family)
MATARTFNKKSHSPKSNAKQPTRFEISIIGAGRLGTTLGRALKHAGHRIEVVVTRRRSSAQRAARTIGGSTLATTDRQLQPSGHAHQRLAQTKLLLISTPDDAIEGAARQLAEVFGKRSRNRRSKVALHTSGALSAEVLAPLREAGFAIGSLHPLISVAGSATAEVFRGAYFCLEGDRAALQAAQRIVKTLGGQGFTIASRSKPLYHAAAAMASGHVVAMFDLASEMLEHCGIPRRRVKQILLPLVESTVANLATKRSADALTGPLARGDVATVRKHLQAMETQGFPESAKIYVAIARHALKLAGSRGIDPQQLKRMDRLLTSCARDL